MLTPQAAMSLAMAVMSQTLVVILHLQQEQSRMLRRLAKRRRVGDFSGRFLNFFGDRSAILVQDPP